MRFGITMLYLPGEVLEPEASLTVKQRHLPRGAVPLLGNVQFHLTGHRFILLRLLPVQKHHIVRVLFQVSRIPQVRQPGSSVAMLYASIHLTQGKNRDSRFLGNQLDGRGRCHPLRRSGCDCSRDDQDASAKCDPR